MAGASRLIPLLKPFPPPSVVYLVLFFLLACGSLASFPIVPGDTDLWYHLSGGRYILEHLAIPRDSFFSFVSPPRVMVDYYWLFQVLVHRLYTWWGYYGLIALRAAAYLATGLLMLRLVFRNRGPAQPLPWLVFISVCACLILLPRFVIVRPHLFTYLFMACFLMLFEHRSPLTWCLPLLAVLWCNLHGIAYPALWLICGAYGVEALLGPRRDLRFAGLALLCILAALATPHGLELLRVRAVSTAGASQYILELQPLPPQELLSFHVSLLAPTHLTFFQVLVAAAGFAGLQGCVRKTLRLSHLVLAAGGLAALTQGNRFMSECTLLLLPLAAANPPVPARRMLRAVSAPVYLVSVGLLMVMPLRSLMDFFRERPAYPFSAQNVPRGVVQFLKTQTDGGDVLNHPNMGGYLQWMLYPTHRIFMDMQVPFVFTDEDMFAASQMFVDATVLKRVTARYHPAFLTVPNTYKDFPTVIAHLPEYVMAFFDDYEVLYVDKTRHPALAAQFKLKALDPFRLVTQTEEDVGKDEPDPDALLREAGRMLAVYPDGALLSQVAASVYLRQGAYDRALPYAQTIIRNFPHWPKGYRIQGDALKGLGRFEEALAAYQSAVERAEPFARVDLLTRIAHVYVAQGRWAEAYKTFKRTTDIFSHETPMEDLYTFGLAALELGKTREAAEMLGYLARYRVPPEDADWQQKLRHALDRPPGVGVKRKPNQASRLRSLR